jgi:hypothetical protein
MTKEEKPIFLKVFSIVLVVLVAEAGAIFFAMRNGYEIPIEVLIAQIPIIIFFLGFAYLKNRRIWRRKVDEYGINLTEIKKHSKTDLDALYTILKNKKEISVRSVANLFKIPQDLAMEWARILESGELVTVEYPGFGSPRILYKAQEKNVTIIPDPKEMKKKKEEIEKATKKDGTKESSSKEKKKVAQSKVQKKNPTKKKEPKKKTVKKNNTKKK